MNKKKLTYFLIEALYLLVQVSFLLYFKKSYSIYNSAYEKQLFLIVLCFVVMITVFLGPIINKIVSFLSTLVFGFYLFSQTIYNNAFDQYYRIKFALSIFDEVAGVKSSVAEFISLSDFVPFIIFAIVNLVFIVLYFLYQRKAVKFKSTIIPRLAVLFLIIPIVLCAKNFNNLLVLAQDQEDPFQLNKTDYYIYDTIPSTTQFVEKFGLITFGYRDFLSFNSEKNWNEYRNEVDEVLANRGSHEDNEMTGIFKGKNVVIIQAESYTSFALDPDLTPTLYKMYSEGINIEGFNTPLLVGSTSDTEFMANTSIIPDSEEYAACYSYIDNYYPTTLASIFKDAGYVTDAYHNCYGEYYNRDLMFPKLLHYDNWYDCTGLGKEPHLADSLYANDLFWMYYGSDTPYMAYWITYSGHQPYSFDSVGVDEDDVNRIKEKYPNLDDTLVSYIAKNMDLDRCIANYIQNATWFEQLDNTVFVVFGDHFAKGLDIGEDATTDLYIYCSAYEGKKYEKHATVLDLLPTLANMFGLEYDNSTILGRDIFDEDYKGYYFSAFGEYEIGNYTYSAKKGVNDAQGNLIEDKEIVDEFEYLINLKRISKIIQKTDYFNENN